MTADKTAVREGGEKTENGPEKAGPRKKLLAIFQIMQYNRGKANKGRDVESWNLPTPLCRRCDLPHSRISAPRSLYRESPLFTRGEFPGMGLCAESGCAGIFVPCTALLFAPTGIACGGRGRPPGRPFGAAMVWRENPMCRQRTARGRSGLPDGISGGLFSAVLPKKKKKFSKP